MDNSSLAMSPLKQMHAARMNELDKVQQAAVLNEKMQFRRKVNHLKMMRTKLAKIKHEVIIQVRKLQSEAINAVSELRRSNKFIVEIMYMVALGNTKYVPNISEGDVNNIKAMIHKLASQVFMTIHNLCGGLESTWNTSFEKLESEFVKSFSTLEAYISAVIAMSHIHYETSYLEELHQVSLRKFHDTCLMFDISPAVIQGNQESIQKFENAKTVRRQTVENILHALKLQYAGQLSILQGNVATNLDVQKCIIDKIIKDHSEFIGREIVCLDVHFRSLVPVDIHYSGVRHGISAAAGPPSSDM